MKNTNNRKVPYNIFNDLVEYEEEENGENNYMDEENESSDSENDSYFYENETKINKEDDIIKYPEKKEVDFPPLENELNLTEIPLESIPLKSSDFPPLKNEEDISLRPLSSTYPPGFEHYPQSASVSVTPYTQSASVTPYTQSASVSVTPKFFKPNPIQYSLLQRNNPPIIIHFKTSFPVESKGEFFREKPSFTESKGEFFKEKPSFTESKGEYPYKKDFINNRSSFPYRKSDFTFKDIKGDQTYPKNKSIIPTKKFTFGNRLPKDASSKCIKSFGIILFTNQNKSWRPNSNTHIINENDIYYLIYQRRDTYGFMDFMRGLWNDDNKMFMLLSMISKDEKKRLLNYNFDELWEDLWMSHSPDPTGIYIAGKERAKRKFYMVREKVLNFLQKPESATNVVCDAPWGFPKGKKNSKESDIECAKREFAEETKIDASNINILFDLGTIIENYIADNDKYYTTFYYIAETPNVLPIKHYPTPGCIRSSAVSDEVANLMWANYSDSSLLLDAQKKCILEEAHSRVMNYIN